MEHLTYCRSLVDELTKPFRVTGRLGRRAPISLERLQPNPHFLGHRHKRVDCVVCSNWLDGKRHLTLFQCDTCSIMSN